MLALDMFREVGRVTSRVVAAWALERFLFRVCPQVRLILRQSCKRVLTSGTYVWLCSSVRCLVVASLIASHEAHVAELARVSQSCRLSVAAIRIIKEGYQAYIENETPEHAA